MKITHVLATSASVLSMLAAPMVLAEAHGEMVAAAEAEGMLSTIALPDSWCNYGGVIADLLTEKAGIQVTPRQTQGPNQNVILVDEKKIELGMTTMGVALQAVQGSGA